MGKTTRKSRRFENYLWKNFGCGLLAQVTGYTWRDQNQPCFWRNYTAKETTCLDFNKWVFLVGGGGCCCYLFIYFGCTHGMWACGRIPKPGIKPCHSSDLNYCRDKARSLTRCGTRKHQSFFFFPGCTCPCGSSRARGLTRTIAAAYATAMATPDPSSICDVRTICDHYSNAGYLTHWSRPGVKPASSQRQLSGP